MDVATRKAAAGACGFINFFGSVGGAVGVGLTGHLAETAAWSPVVGLCADGAAVAAVGVALLWNVRGGHSQWL